MSGESHYFEGRRYRLRVIERAGRPSVRLLNNTIMQLSVPPAADRDTRDAVLQRWYRRQLRDRLPELLAKWEPRVGVDVTEARIKRMKTCWGTCQADARRIWLDHAAVARASGRAESGAARA